MGTFLGVPIIRIIVYWGLYWGPPVLGIYHISKPKPMPCQLNCDALLALNLVHITLGRKKDPFFLNIRNPIPQKVKRIPNIDPVKPCGIVLVVLPADLIISRMHHGNPGWSPLSYACLRMTTANQEEPMHGSGGGSPKWVYKSWGGVLRRLEGFRVY